MADLAAIVQRAEDLKLATSVLRRDATDGSFCSQAMVDRYELVAVARELRSLLDEVLWMNNHEETCPAYEWSGTRPECKCGWQETLDEAGPLMDRTKALEVRA